MVNGRRRILGVFLLAALLVLLSIYSLTKSQKVGTLVITSDTHISNPIGRWPQTTAQFKSLIESLDEEPEIFFTVGDFIDNVQPKDDGVGPGNLEYWRSEIDLYRSFGEKTDTEFLHTYGPGHDYIGKATIEMAEKYTGVARRGTKKWGSVNLVWATVYPAVFTNDDDTPPAALTEDDYLWLAETLENSDNTLFLTHVPIRTEKTFQDGVWPGNQNLSIPEIDRLYDIIDQNLTSIIAIFHGHIHTPSQSFYKDIPVYLCPAFGTGCHCVLKQTGSNVMVSPIECSTPELTIPLNDTTNNADT